MNHDRLAGPTESHVQPWLTAIDAATNQAHVVPSFGPKHVLSMRCWCHPVIDHDYSEPAVSHNVAQ